METFYFIGLAAATGLGAMAAIFLSLRFEAVRNWRIRRYIRNSRQPEEVVWTWFKGSYNLLSDSLYRFLLICLALMFATACLAIVAPSVFNATLPGYPRLAVFHYCLGITFDLVIFTIAFMNFLVAEALIRGRLVASLPFYNYKYEKAEEGGRFWLRYGVIASISARVFALIVFGIAWFIASGLYDGLRADLLLTVGGS